MEPQQPQHNQPYTNNIQNTFTFDSLIITSQFNSGNLYSCTQVSQTEYSLQVGYDCQGNELPFEISLYKIWFYYGVKLTNETLKHTDITFTITNMNNLTKLFGKGYQIVYRELPPDTTPEQYENSYNENEEYEWKRLNVEYKYDIIPDTNILQLTFEYVFNDSNVYVLFAFCFPWSYNKNIKFLKHIQNKVKEYNNTNIIGDSSNKIFFHNTILTQSKQNRNLNLLTITSTSNVYKNITDQPLTHLFPTNNLPPKLNKNKPIIFISARVHPGETPSSLMLNSIIKLLTNPNNPLTFLLLSNFIFKIIPIINVDGVSNGHFRLDTTGINLNRCYINPSNINDPEIYAIKSLFMFYCKEYSIRYYFDLHADMNVKGVYTFGNAITDFLDHVENVVFSLIYRINCSNVNWKRCTFSEGCMKTKNKYDLESKEATGRVRFYRLTGIIHSYTVESTYFKGKFNAFGKRKKKKNGGDEIYEVVQFENSGRDLVLAVLDYEEIYTSECLKKSMFRSVNECRRYIADRVVNNVKRYRSDQKLKQIAKVISSERKWVSIKELNDKVNDVVMEVKRRIKSVEKENKQVKLDKVVEKKQLPPIRKLNTRDKEKGSNTLEQAPLVDVNNVKSNIVKYNNNVSSNKKERKRISILAINNEEKRIMDKKQRMMTLRGLKVGGYKNGNVSGNGNNFYGMGLNALKCENEISNKVNVWNVNDMLGDGVMWKEVKKKE